MPTMTAIAAPPAGAENIERLEPLRPSSSMKMSTSALPSISTTGSNTLARGDRERRATRPGRGVGNTSGLTGPAHLRHLGRGANVSGASTTTQRPASLPNRGPATMIVGIATTTEAEGSTQIGVEQAGMAVNALGCGDEAVHGRKSGQRRDSHRDERSRRERCDTR